MNEKIKELIKVMAENPGLEVKFMVSSETSSTEPYTAQKIANIIIDIWAQINEYIFTDYEDFITYIVELENEFETIAEAEAKYPIESFDKKIIVYLE